MQIKDEVLREYQVAHEKDFGEQITLDQAREQLTRLVTFYELVGQPLPEQTKE